MTSENDVSLCKLRNRTERRLLVASASLNLNRNSLKEKVLLYSKFYFENQNAVNQKVCKEKYLSWVYDVDRKIRHSGSLFGITQKAL